ncbi:MAG: HAD family hydrolase [Myxococcales bacterium]|nr:HAD family hydrolase [Myxococcales bacterium]
MARAVIFDLDGTLADTLADIAASMNHALAALGLPVHDECAYREFVGAGVEQLGRNVLPRGAAASQVAVVAEFRRHYAEHLLDRSVPFAGIVALLDALDTRGVRRAVLSNKPEWATLRMVTALFAEPPFAVVAGDREGFPRKPDPTRALAVAAELSVVPAACLFVGDTPIDMATARAAGMVAVGVSWGFRPPAELLAAGAAHLIDHPGELLALL